MTTTSERIRRRRCIGFRVAFVFGIVLAVLNRGDWLLLAITLAGMFVLAFEFWRECRRARPSS
jgi:hypothetical protein